MSWASWLPWRFILSRAARRQGFLDPIELMARLRALAQPSEVDEPVELLRAGLVFHARGLINTKVIQHNLDWVWPYWIDRQFDPRDPSFIPRAFSISHINLTHRNWTAIGHPDCEELPIVDPRGLLTPLLDGWSVDCWIITDDGRCLLPSRAVEVEQHQELDRGVAVVTRTGQAGLQLTTRVEVEVVEGEAVCRLAATATADTGAWLVLALRSCNPEGVSFIHQVALADDRRSWRVDEHHSLEFSEPVARHHVSDYQHGDVFIHLDEHEDSQQGSCKVGMATAAAMFPLQPGIERTITATMPLRESGPQTLVAGAWDEIRAQACKLSCPEPRYQMLYDAAVSSLVLHSPDDVYPGPYTYKRFWFRDAAFLIHALLCLGLNARAERALARFPARQTPLGYFRSQDGEWDSNGEVLWILQRFEQLTGARLDPGWHGPIKRAARWIIRKRLDSKLDAPHAGLLPAGFSAEHLGPNDFYYWDDFWSVSGLHAAAELIADQDAGAAADFTAAAQDFAAAIDRSLEQCARRLRRPGMPASPYRRLDSGAIGSLVAGYPLQACAPDDVRLQDTVDFLLAKCFLDDAFFQDMIHSGLNAYLTLHVAQVLLRAGNPRYLDLMDAVAGLATSTGQWPEAIHPRTMGGCMGDGHHVWASAEWILMLRHCFVREEGERLILCAGVPARWLTQRSPVSFGPAPTSFGTVSVIVTPLDNEQTRVEWQADWHAEPPPIELRLPGHEVVSVTPGVTSMILSHEGAPR
ncbi:hypothetical protein [Kineobactrum salinum]|uniref:Glycoside hydrolase family 15 protein n=1 Tax=Kineobactrum salinum TaxID=2708301 RepID=A0A6C0UB54_9GAMM|nr:hypothetical protein [Kineobactrum salinum]QIB67214.1 hypothetical protein G3T16_19190 [Kineobactrum salinum]